MSSERKGSANLAVPSLIANGAANSAINDLSLDADVIPIVTIREAPTGPRLPTLLKFPIVVLINFSLTVLANTVLVEFTGPQLYPVARNLREDWQMGIVTTWKILELGVGWFGGFDGLDMLSFTFLTHIPHAYLLQNFYVVPTTTLYVFLLSEVAASALPFHLLRRRNLHHRRSFGQSLVGAGPSLADTSTYLLVSLVAATVYALPIVLSLTTWLPLHLARTFYGLRTLEPARTATLPTALLTLLPLGLAAADYLFNAVALYSPSTVPVEASIPGSHGEKTFLEFNPATATFAQTLHRNMFWHKYLPARTQELLGRSSALVAWTAANTAFLAVMEVEGGEVLGSIGWAAAWTVGAASCCAMVGWIAGVAV